VFPDGASIAFSYLMAEQSFNANTDIHYECLDMFPVTWTPAGVEEQGLEAGILLEIWKTGGMLQSSVSIPEGALVELTPADRAICATITRCEQEASGYLISFLINEGQYNEWFPKSYCPPNLYGDEDERRRFAHYDSTTW
jgi:hypothetical protein